MVGFKPDLILPNLFVNALMYSTGWCICISARDGESAVEGHSGERRGQAQPDDQLCYLRQVRLVGHLLGL